MTGGFAIKLLQAKQSTWSHHTGPVAFHSCMEIYPSPFHHPEEITGIIFVITITH